MKPVRLRPRAAFIGPAFVRPAFLRPVVAALGGALAALFIHSAHADLPTVPARAAVEAAPAVGTSGLAQAALGMALVLGLIFACAWVARRFGLQRLGGGGNLVKVVSSASVGQRERVVVVEVGGTWLVLGVTPTQVNALHALPAGAQPPVAALSSAASPAAAHTGAPVAPATTALRGRSGSGASLFAGSLSSANAAKFDPVWQFAQKLNDSLSGKSKSPLTTL